MNYAKKGASLFACNANMCKTDDIKSMSVKTADLTGGKSSYAQQNHEQNTNQLYTFYFSYSAIPRIAIFSRACFYESRVTYPVTIVCACLLVCLWTAVAKNIQQVALVFLTIQFSVAKYNRWRFYLFLAIKFSVAKIQQVVLLFLIKDIILNDSYETRCGRFSATNADKHYLLSAIPAPL